MQEIGEAFNRAIIDRYRVLKELGRGGMAVVLLAEDLRHSRQVAIKVLSPEIAHSVGAGRFLEEIRVSAQLTHPHILPLLDSGEAAGLVYYVTPFIDGGTLRDRLSREGQLGTDETLRITRDIAGALAHAHSRGVLHRDIKPENILLTPGHAILADFGIARAMEAAGAEQLTGTGVTVGTPSYMSPEQALGERDLDGRSDQYSLASVAYEMLVGEPPFTGPSPQAIIGRRLSEVPRRVQATRTAVGGAVDEAIARALALSRADRYASMEQFVAALSDVDHARPPDDGRKPWRRIVAAAAIVAVLIVTTLVLMQRPGSPLPSSGQAPRLAVLPLENLGAVDDAPFTDGISEEITSRLATIEALRVVSRTSARAFRSSDRAIPEVGKALNADFILEGTVRTDRVSGGAGMARVSTQLIRVADDVLVWQRQFDVPLVPGEIFRVQAEIAARVAEAMNLTLGEPERQRIARVTTADSAAYRLYQLGRFHWEKRDAASLARAKQYFEEAIARDSTFAEAYAGLAAAHVDAILFATSSGRDAGKPAITAAQRAIALDSSLAAAHAVLGFALTFFEWDWERADSAYTRAIALDPAYGPARYWYTQLLWLQNRPAEALEQARQAIAVDPLSSIAHLAYARSLRLNGRADEWAVELGRTAELQPGLWIPYADLAEYHTSKGEPGLVSDDVRRFLAAAYPGHSFDQETVGALVKVLGGNGDAARVVRRLEGAGIRLQPGVAARWFALTGQSDSALERMREAIDQHSPDVMTTLPFLRSLLRSTQGWPELMRSVRLTP